LYLSNKTAAGKRKKMAGKWCHTKIEHEVFGGKKKKEKKRKE